MLKDLKLLKSANLRETLDLGDLQLVVSEPTSDSAFFRVTRTTKTRSLLLTSVVAICVIVMGLYVGSLPESVQRYAVTLFTCLLVILTMVARTYRQNAIVAEAVLAVKGMGIQLFSESRNGEIYNVKNIEISRISEILINEAFTAFKVVEYLAIDLVPLGHKPGVLVLPFQHIEIPIDWQVKILRAMRKTLEIVDSPIPRKPSS